MRIFGKPWDSPATDDAEIVPTPIGEVCFHCEEAIESGDSGVRQNLYGIDGVRVIHEHRDCFLRSILGSAGHQLGLCSCQGGDYDDPPGMTKRQAATTAVALFYHLHDSQLVTPKGGT